MAQDSYAQGGHYTGGNVSQSSNLAGLFGGNKTFNLGAGSSSFDISTNSVDLSSLVKDDSTNTTRKETSGGGFDAALSLGVGMGGSGSGGSVEKVTSTNKNDSSTLGVGGSSGSNTPLYIALGVGAVGVLLIILKKRRK